MIVLLSTTIITCSQAIQIVNRLQQVIGLTYNQKVEIVKEVTKLIPSCPIRIMERNQ